MKYHIKQHTFKILISFPSSICDFDKFFLLILLIATSQSVFWKGKVVLFREIVLQKHHLQGVLSKFINSGGGEDGKESESPIGKGFHKLKANVLQDSH